MNTTRDVTERYAPIRLWLYIVAFLIVVIVMVGGATRLTDSGLSITEWAPIRGAIPPLSLAGWEAEFAKYKTTTEFQTINSLMTLDEFKFIYWWEWGHRLLGRLIGIVVIIPLIVFWALGRLDAWLKPRLLFWLFLGSLQGVVGWWMVKSGLVGRVDVSHLRLAVHLTLACVVFSLTIWLARSITSHTRMRSRTGIRSGVALLLLLFLQIFLGGLVAGLDAGMAYNTWPSMNGEFLPQAAWTRVGGWTGLADNAAMVQFVHRMVAYAVWGLSLLHALRLNTGEGGTTHSRRGWIVWALVSVQVLIGIVTLVSQVPLNLALIHQIAAIVILGFLTAHLRGLMPRLMTERV